MKEINKLFPVFLKLEQMNLLLIGAGNVALEKLTAIHNNAPQTRLRIVASYFSPEVKALSGKMNAELIEADYSIHYLSDMHLVIVAVNDIPLAEQIVQDAHKYNLLVNVADKPALCDFYLGSIVSKGNLKIAISTNGKSPTIAKRLKEILQDLLPDELDDLLDNMQAIRNKLRGDFHEKVKKLNELTKALSSNKNEDNVSGI